MPRTAFLHAGLPTPAGPYSHAVRLSETVVASGQAGFDADGVLETGIAAQARRCFENLLAALAEAGADETSIVRVGVYLTSTDDFVAMNEVYRECFHDPYPARTTVYVGLPPGMLIEADAAAVVEVVR